MMNDGTQPLYQGKADMKVSEIDYSELRDLCAFVVKEIFPIAFQRNVGSVFNIASVCFNSVHCINCSCETLDGISAIAIVLRELYSWLKRRSTACPWRVRKHYRPFRDSLSQQILAIAAAPIDGANRRRPHRESVVSEQFCQCVETGFAHHLFLSANIL